MSTTNKAKVWCLLPTVKDAALVALALDRRRMKPRANGIATRVEFNVPRGMTIQDAILVLSRIAPRGTEIFVS